MHASALDALIVAAYLLIVMFVLRQIAARTSDRPIGKAIAALVA